MKKWILPLALTMILPLSATANGNHDRNKHTSPPPEPVSINNGDGHSSTGKRVLVFGVVVAAIWCAMNKCLDSPPAADPEPNRVSVDTPPSFEVETSATRGKR